jgi:hypothetical protein
MGHGERHGGGEHLEAAGALIGRRPAHLVKALAPAVQGVGSPRAGVWGDWLSRTF